MTDKFRKKCTSCKHHRNFDEEGGWTMYLLPVPRVGERTQNFNSFCIAAWRKNSTSLAIRNGHSKPGRDRPFCPQFRAFEVCYGSWFVGWKFKEITSCEGCIYQKHLQGIHIQNQRWMYYGWTPFDPKDSSISCVPKLVANRFNCKIIETFTLMFTCIDGFTHAFKQINIKQLLFFEAAHIFKQPFNGGWRILSHQPLSVTNLNWPQVAWLHGKLLLADRCSLRQVVKMSMNDPSWDDN